MKPIGRQAIKIYIPSKNQGEGDSCLELQREEDNSQEDEK